MPGPLLPSGDYWLPFSSCPHFFRFLCVRWKPPHFINLPSLQNSEVSFRQLKGCQKFIVLFVYLYSFASFVFLAVAGVAVFDDSFLLLVVAVIVEAMGYSGPQNECPLC